MVDRDTRSEIVMALAEEFLERYRKGERPPLRDYVDRHPELAGEIREVFPAMAMLERGIPLGPATANRQPHGV